MSIEAMRESVERRKRSQFEPESYGFEGKTVEYVREALEKGGDKVICKLGQKEDGSPEAWLVVKGRDQILYAGNFSYTCPPRPPADCVE